MRERERVERETGGGRKERERGERERAERVRERKSFGNLMTLMLIS